MRRQFTSLAGVKSQALTDAQVSDLLARNQSLRGAVYDFDLLTETFFTYHQGGTNEVGLLAWLTSMQSPIHQNGSYIIDDKYGMVVVFPGADGTLHFTATDTPGGADPLGVYTSLAGVGVPLAKNISDLLTLGAAVLIGFAVFEGVGFLRSVRR